MRMEAKHYSRQQKGALKMRRKQGKMWVWMTDDGTLDRLHHLKVLRNAVIEDARRMGIAVDKGQYRRITLKNCI